MTAKFLSHDSAALQTMVGGIKTAAYWWWDQISSLWPMSLLLADTKPQTVLVRVQSEPPAGRTSMLWLPLDIETATQTSVDALKETLGDKAATVLLDASQLYVCHAAFPKAALTAGSEALDYHLQTASPLPVDQIYYDSKQVIDGDKAQVNIALVRRSTIDDIITFFETHTLPLDRIEGRKDESSGGAYCFYKPVSFGQGLVSARTALALCASLLLLPVLCAAVIWAYGTYISQALESQLEAERATYAQEITRARDFDRYNVIQTVLREARTPGQLAEGVADISGAVPRTAWLDRLTVDGAALTLQGYAEDANGVASNLRALPMLQTLRLDRVTASGSDQRAPLFAISSQWTRQTETSDAQ